jgi:hypothetical protein
MWGCQQNDGREVGLGFVGNEKERFWVQRRESEREGIRRKEDGR